MDHGGVDICALHRHLPTFPGLALPFMFCFRCATLPWYGSWWRWRLSVTSPSVGLSSLPRGAVKPAPEEYLFASSSDPFFSPYQGTLQMQCLGVIQLPRCNVFTSTTQNKHWSRVNWDSRFFFPFNSFSIFSLFFFFDGSHKLSFFDGSILFGGKK